jgi:hypothetical protein
VSTADAVSREAAWLNTALPDGLPLLPTAAGGPWDVIQAYMPRTPIAQKTQIYVLRRKLVTVRFAQQRRMATHHMHLSCVWPIGASSTASGIAESEQQALDAALALLVQRIEGPVGDKTHGGRFMSVAEAPNGTGIDVDVADPAQAIPSGYLTASVTYLADDPDYTA